MTGRGCCYAGLRCLCQTCQVHWSFHLLCNCRVGMTYVRIVPSFITHSQLLATTTSWCGRQSVEERISSQSLQNKYLTFSDLRLSSPASRQVLAVAPVTRSQLPHVYSPLTWWFCQEVKSTSIYEVSQLSTLNSQQSSHLKNVKLKQMII